MLRDVNLNWAYGKQCAASIRARSLLLLGRVQRLGFPYRHLDHGPVVRHNNIYVRRTETVVTERGIDLLLGGRNSLEKDDHRLAEVSGNGRIEPLLPLHAFEA